MREVGEGPLSQPDVFATALYGLTGCPVAHRAGRRSRFDGERPPRLALTTRKGSFPSIVHARAGISISIRDDR